MERGRAARVSAVCPSAVAAAVVPIRIRVVSVNGREQVEVEEGNKGLTRSPT